MSTSDDSSPGFLLTKIKSLEIQLSELQRRYDLLSKNHESAMTHWGQDYKRWSTIKRNMYSRISSKDTTSKRYRESGSKRVAIHRGVKPDLRGLETLQPADFLVSTVDKSSDAEGCISRRQPLAKIDVNKKEGVPAASCSRISYKVEVGSDGPLDDVPKDHAVSLLSGIAGQDNMKTAYPSRADEGNPSTNYLKYKGRGRYSNANSIHLESTINNTFEIKANMNGGLDFPYDDVVRNRQERKHLLGEDCECCRDYYEAVGPLPQRLQQPVWSSSATCPPVTSSHSDLTVDDATTLINEDMGWQEEVQHHKNLISRHRHQWPRSKTPPGYWDIGFPNTQEASDINRQAQKMHTSKRKAVEIESRNQDGKYRRR